MIKRAAAGVWDFVVGDDWLMAAGVVIILLVGWAVASVAGSWIVVLLGVALTLVLSLRRAVRSLR